MFDQPLKLYPRVQHYAWGKPATHSLVAKLSGQKFEPSRPCAELWFGAHPAAPSLVNVAGQLVPLNRLIEENALELLGPTVFRQYGAQLPFLFKVLSIAKPLSIQLHPTRAQAQLLHQRDPVHYPDSNHKPEIGIALSPTRLLYGFREFAQIHEFVRDVPELAKLLGSVIRDGVVRGGEDEGGEGGDNSALLAKCYQRILTAEPEIIKNLCQELYVRLASKRERRHEEGLIVELASEYPQGDPGIFCIFLHNLLELQCGEAVYIPAGVPHAYLQGDLIECMSNSDSVVRAGLTPKFKDANTLLQVVDYHCGGGQVVPQVSVSTGLRFVTPASDFTIEKCNPGIVQTGNHPQLLFCLNGICRLRLGEKEALLETAESALIPAAVSEFELQLTGAEVYRVSAGGSFT